MTIEPRSWSLRLLLATFWVGHILGHDGEDARVAHESWANLPLGGTVDFAELHAAERALIDVGLITQHCGRLHAAPELAACTAEASTAMDSIELALALVLDRESPLWLRTAAAEESNIKYELLPDDVRAALSVVIPDPDRREAFLLARAAKVEVHERTLLGDEGEEAVVAGCRTQLAQAGAAEMAAAVRRVSSISDELGFDVSAPRIDGSTRRIEVKATRSHVGAVRVFVTRNEIITGLADPDWYLVVVCCEHNGNRAVLGHASAAELLPMLPTDQHSRGRWQMARLRLSVVELEPGLPPI